MAWARTAYELSERRALPRAGRGALKHPVPVRTASPGAPPEPAAGAGGGPDPLWLSAPHVLLRREGWRVNHKRVYRLYTDEGLTLKRRRPKRHRSASPRPGRPPATRPAERWTMDFMHDTLASGQAIRVLTILDAYTRECLGLVAQARFTGRDVAGHLGQIAAIRQAPTTIGVDNGTEFTSRAMDHWAYWNRVELDFRPGRPGDNALIEAFNGRLQPCAAPREFGAADPGPIPGRAQPPTRTGPARRVAGVATQDRGAEPQWRPSQKGWPRERGRRREPRTGPGSQILEAL